MHKGSTNEISRVVVIFLSSEWRLVTGSTRFSTMASRRRVETRSKEPGSRTGAYHRDPERSRYTRCSSTSWKLVSSSGRLASIGLPSVSYGTRNGSWCFMPEPVDPRLGNTTCGSNDSPRIYKYTRYPSPRSLAIALRHGFLFAEVACSPPNGFICIRIYTTRGANARLLIILGPGL